MPDNGAMDVDDMEQDAAIGVLDAARTFDRSRGTSFATLAYLRAIRCAPGRTVTTSGLVEGIAGSYGRLGRAPTRTCDRAIGALD